MATTNNTRPKIAVIQPFHKLSGRTTTAAPRHASAKRNRAQELSLRWSCSKRGKRRSAKKRAAPTKPRRLGRNFASSAAIAVGVVLMAGCRLFYIRLKPLYLSHSGKGTADVRDGDGASDDQGDVEGIDDLVAFPADVAAADEMVGDAVVAAENGRGREAEKFLGAGVERAGFVGLVVQGEEAFDAEVAAVEDFLVELGAKFLKVVYFVGHESSARTALALYRRRRAVKKLEEDFGQGFVGEIGGAGFSCKGEIGP